MNPPTVDCQPTARPCATRAVYKIDRMMTGFAQFSGQLVATELLTPAPPAYSMVGFAGRSRPSLYHTMLYISLYKHVGVVWVRCWLSLGIILRACPLPAIIGR